MFSSFIDYGGDKSEKFHLFYEKFHTSFQRGTDFYIKRTPKPYGVNFRDTKKGFSDYVEEKDFKRLLFLGTGKGNPSPEFFFKQDV